MFKNIRNIWEYIMKKNSSSQEINLFVDFITSKRQSKDKMIYSVSDAVLKEIFEKCIEPINQNLITVDIFKAIKQIFLCINESIAQLEIGKNNII